MEQNMENEYNDDMLFDGKMLNKLRECNIIPKSPSEFQIFVRGLAGDTVSDMVIQEVWKQIYTNKGDSPVLPTPEVVSKSQEQTRCTLETDIDMADPTPVTECILRNNSKQNILTHSEVQNSKKAEMPCHENRVKMFNSDACVADIASQLTTRNQNITLNSVFPVTQRDVNRQISMYPVIKTSEQMGWHCSSTNIKDSTLLEKDQMEETTSSYSKVIEIVSLDSSSDTDSETSIEILDSTIRQDRMATGKNSSASACPIHGNRITKFSNSWNNNRKSRDMDAHSSEDYNLVNKHRKSVNTDKQQKGKRERQGKYKMLRSELKNLKVLLVNLLMSMKSPIVNDCGEGTSTTIQDDFDSGDKQKKRKGRESFHTKQRKKKVDCKSRIASKEKVRASAFVEVNMSRKITKTGQKKQRTADHSTKNYNRPTETKLDSDMNGYAKRQKFNWRGAIAEVLKTKSTMQMPVEKLKRTVVAKYYYYRGNVSQNTTEKFFRYLHSTPRVVVDGDMARYVKKPLIHVSSKSEKKHLLLETLTTTTKKYKVS